MSRKKKELPLIENVTITDVAAEGNAIARVDDLVVFVPYVVPGDVVDLQLTRKKHSYAEAKAVRFQSYSKEREEAFCEHFGICGGCVWQILPYEKQLFYKQKQVVDTLTRIGKVALPSVSPILGSEKTRYYRNKLEFTFSNRRYLTKEQIASGEPFDRCGLGFHISGCFDKVLPIEACHLQSEWSNTLRNTIRDYAIDNGYSFHDLRTHEGMLRGMIVRTASTGEKMLIMIAKVCGKEEMDQFLELMAFIRDRFPEITSLEYVLNDKCNDSIGDLDCVLFSGRDHIFEQMEGLRFKIGPKSFYQTNSLQAYNLYKVVRNLAGLNGDELVYDLYTGTGTIANFVAGKARRVIGIEYVREAIEDARVNAKLNHLDNTLFFDGDMKDILTLDFIKTYGKPDVIITDPPRSGMHPEVLAVLLRTRAPRIVYVSCNPATQARDLQVLEKAYQVKAVQPVDMFPHTQHVENVVLLELRPEASTESEL